MADELRVAEESCCAVVVGVKKCQRLLSEYQEGCVAEFEEFGQIIEVVQCRQGGCEASVATHAVTQTFRPKCRNKLLNH